MLLFLYFLKSYKYESKAEEKKYKHIWIIKTGGVNSRLEGLGYFSRWKVDEEAVTNLAKQRYIAVTQTCCLDRGL